MSKLQKQPEEPRFPSVRRKCRYCGCQFNTKPTYNGSKMKFCKSQHRKAFDKEGEKPIDVILRKQERRMREMAREEIAAALDRFATVSLLQIMPKLLDRYFPGSILQPITSVTELLKPISERLP